MRIGRADRSRVGEHEAEQALLADGETGPQAPPRRGHAQARGAGEQRQLARGLGAVPGPRVAVLREHPRHEIVERVGDLEPQLLEARRLLEQHLREDAHHVLGEEHRAAREALEEHAAEGEDVGARVDVAGAASLLGRHVAGRAHGDAGAGVDAVPDGEPRDAEIEDLHVEGPPADEEEVLRLHVAVDDAARVRRAERLRRPLRQRDAGRDPEPLALGAGEVGAEILALEPLDRQPSLAVAVAPVGHVAHDRRVLELGQHLGLALEAIEPDVRPMQRFERHRRAGPMIDRAVHGAHPACASEALDLEPPRDQFSWFHGSASARRCYAALR